MELTENAEEILESLWLEIEEEYRPGIPVERLSKKALDQLVKAGFVEIKDGMVTFTEAGRPEARSVVRRHRLAERLLLDVLGASDNIMHEHACKFEHILDRGLDDTICVLLGHPKVCPHGKPIPPGRCCAQRSGEAYPLVVSLSSLTPGQKGKVAYIYATQQDKLQKLMAMGILPGAPVELLQSFPSYVFRTRESQFATDKEIADAIYVRLVEPETSELEPTGHGRRRFRFGFRRWGKG